MAFLRRDSDAELVRRTLSGQRTAYNALVERHLRLVYAVGQARAPSGTDVEDVAQDAFLAAFERLPSLRDPARFKAWLVGIVRNTAAACVRRQSREGEVMARFKKEREGRPVPVATEAESREVCEFVRREIDQLDGSVREVVLLYYFAGQDSREIAESLEISPAAVRKRLQRAREALGERLLAFQTGEQQEEEETWKARAHGIAGAIALAEAPWLLPAASTAVGAANAAQSASSGGSTMFTGSTLLKVGLAAVLTATVVVSGVLVLSPEEEDASEPPSSPEVAQAEPESSAEVAPAEAQAAEEDTLSELLVGLIAVTKATAPDKPDPLTGPYAFTGWVDRPGATIVLVRTQMYGLPIVSEQAIERMQTADEYGYFRFSELPIGKFVVLAFSEDGFAAEDGRTDLDPEVFVEMRMMPTRPLSGRVVDEGGAPVGEATLYAHRYAFVPERLPYTVTTAAAIQTEPDGSFCIPYAWPGKWMMWVSAEGHANTLSDWIETGEDNVLVVNRGATLRGQVVDGLSGDPLPGVPVLVTRTESGRERVWRDRKHVVTSDEGTFEAQVRRGQSYYATVDSGEWVGTEPCEAAVEQDEEPSEITLSARVSAIVGGRAYDADTGEGLAGQRVRAPVPGNPETFGFLRMETLTDADGNYQFKGISEGPCSIRLWRCEGYLDESGTVTVDVEYGDTLLDVDIPVSKGVPIQGVVFDALGAPASLAKVEAQSSAGKSIAVSKPDGTFYCTLPKGVDEVTLVAIKPGMRMRPMSPLNVPPEGLSGVALHLDGTGTIAGVVVDTDGSPMSRISVIAEHKLHPAQSPRDVDVNPDGSFRMNTLLPGTSVLRLSKHNDRTKVTVGEVSVKAGQVLEGLTLVYEEPPETESEGYGGLVGASSGESAG